MKDVAEALKPAAAVEPAPATGLAIAIAIAAIVVFHATTWIVNPGYWSSPVWDEGFYTDIARHGYQVQDGNWLRESNTAFGPGLPLLQRALHAVTGVPPEMLRSSLAAACFLVAMPLLARVLHHMSPGAPQNRQTLLLFALWPGALYFLSGYAESLYLPILLGFFALLQVRRWWLAAAAAALAMFVRVPAVVLVATLAVAILADATAGGGGRGAIRRAAGRLAITMPIASLGLAAHMLVLHFAVGDPLAFLKAYSAWDLALVQDARHWTFENAAEALAIHARGPLSYPIAVLFCVLAPVVLIVERRSLPLPMLAFASFAWLLFLSQNTMAYPFQNHLRWLAVVFPIHHALVLCCRRLPLGRVLYWLGILCCAVAYVYFVSRFVRARWVS